MLLHRAAADRLIRSRLPDPPSLTPEERLAPQPSSTSTPSSSLSSSSSSSSPSSPVPYSSSLPLHPPSSTAPVPPSSSPPPPPPSFNYIPSYHPLHSSGASEDLDPAAQTTSPFLLPTADPTDLFGAAAFADFAGAAAMLKLTRAELAARGLEPEAGAYTPPLLSST